MLLDQGALTVADTPVQPYEMAYQGVGSARLALANTGAEPVRAVVLGGTPFTEEILMWWNFVGRSREELARAVTEWNAGAARFGEVRGYPGNRLPAPLPPWGSDGA